MSIADLVDAANVAFRNRDLEGFLTCFAPNVEHKDFEGNVVEDLEQMREHFGPLFLDSAQLNVTVRSRMVVGDFVIDEEVVEAIPLAGSPTKDRGVVVYRVTDGAIRQWMWLS
jgi:uncharacterized protein (TIGR02246 family)